MPNSRQYAEDLQATDGVDRGPDGPSAGDDATNDADIEADIEKELNDMRKVKSDAPFTPIKMDTACGKRLMTHPHHHLALLMFAWQLFFSRPIRP